MDTDTRPVSPWRGRADAALRGPVEIGIGVSATSVRLVALHRGRVTWHAEVLLSDVTSLQPALEQLLASLPAPGWGRRRAIAAIGPSGMRLRRIGDLPANASDRILSAIVREDLGRYFVQGGVPLVATRASRRGGNVWVGALERPMLAAIAAACATRKVALYAVVPVVDLAGTLVGDGSVRWRDGTVSGVAEYARGELAAYRRVPMSVEEDRVASPVTVPRSAGMMDDADEYADAWLAAALGRRSRIACRPDAPADDASTRRRVRRAASALAASVVIATGGMLATAYVVERDASGTIEQLAAQGREADGTQWALRTATSELRAFRAFDRGNRSMTLTLAALTQSIEAPTTVVSFQSDSAGATLVAVTPSPATLLDELGAVPGAHSPSIVGSVLPVIRAGAGGPPMPMSMSPGPIALARAEPDVAEPMQRVTIRFRWGHAPSTSTERSAAPNPPLLQASR